MEKASLPMAYFLNNGEPDKTGYQQVALSAYYKAINFHPSNSCITLGPNAETKAIVNEDCDSNINKIGLKDSDEHPSFYSSKSSFPFRQIKTDSLSAEASVLSIPSTQISNKHLEDFDSEMCISESQEQKEDKFIRRRILTSLENICLMESQEKIFNLRREWLKRNEEDMSRLQEELNSSKKLLEEKMKDELRKKETVIEEISDGSPVSELDEQKEPKITWSLPTFNKVEEAGKKIYQSEREQVQQSPLLASKSPTQDPLTTKTEVHGSIMVDGTQTSTKKDTKPISYAEKSRPDKNNYYGEPRGNSSTQRSNAPPPSIGENSEKVEKVNEEKVIVQQNEDKLETVEDNSKMDEDLMFEDKKQPELSIQDTKVVDPETERISSVMTHYMKYWKIYNDLSTSLKEFINNDSLKKFRSDCQKAVNVPVNAISGVSAAHLIDKLNKLTSLLSGESVLVSNKSFSPSEHPLGIKYCMFLLAEKIVKQGEDAVSVKSDSAFPIALVALELFRKFPSFGELLIGVFHKKCPYLVPIYWIKEEGMLNEDYYRKLGFKYDGKERENIDMFLKRQGGIVRLYFSIVISHLRNTSNESYHPLPLTEAWRWLAMFTALEPSAEITATLLYDMLEIAGHSLLKTYGKQFLKLIYLICVHFMPKVEKVTPEGKGGPVSRLKSFLEQLIRSQAVKPPKGLLPSNFW